jgi:RNA polymerase sigma-70 factor (ECF subfamily)
MLGLHDNMKYFAYSLTMNHDDAFDLLQDTYVKAITNKDKFDPNTNLKAWVYTIMKNTFINNYRREQKTNTIIDSTDDLYYLNNSKRSEGISPDSAFQHNEISKTVDNLEDEHRIPFQMHVEGYKYKEIAEKLNLSIGTVKSRIFFSRKKLMDKLGDYAN